MSLGYWQLIQEFWNGVPFSATTRLMSEYDWDSKFGISDFIGYTLLIFCMLPLWVLAVGLALIALQKDIAHGMITGMKRKLTGKKHQYPSEDQSC